LPNKSWNDNGLNYLLKKLRDTGIAANQEMDDVGWLECAQSHTVENVDRPIVNDMVMSYRPKGTLKCIKPHAKL